MNHLATLLGGLLVWSPFVSAQEAGRLASDSIYVMLPHAEAPAVWEWSPGSTLFLVWQQSRAGRIQASEFDETGAFDVGNFDLGYDTQELFGLRSDNIFLVKVNYWLNL